VLCPQTRESGYNPTCPTCPTCATASPPPPNFSTSSLHDSPETRQIPYNSKCPPHTRNLDNSSRPSRWPKRWSIRPPCLCRHHLNLKATFASVLTHSPSDRIVLEPLEGSREDKQSMDRITLQLCLSPPCNPIAHQPQQRPSSPFLRPRQYQPQGTPLLNPSISRNDPQRSKSGRRKKPRPRSRRKLPLCPRSQLRRPSLVADSTSFILEV